MGRLVNFCAGVSKEVLPDTHVPNILINVPETCPSDAAIEQAKQMFNYAGTETVMLDSGGFQLFTAEQQGKSITFDSSKQIIISDKKINLCAQHVVETACKVRPQIMVALDYPIKKTSNPAAREKEFLGKLGFNVIWAKRTAELRESYCPETELFLPIQCYTIEQLDSYIDQIGDIAYDGVSMPVRNMSIKEIGLFFAKYYQLGIRKVHLLGTQDFCRIGLCAFMARNFFDWVSLDSTTWRLAAQFENYLSPHGLYPLKISESTIIDERITGDCRCPWCQGKSFTYIKNLPYQEKNSFLRCHNFWVIERAAEELFEKANDIITLEAYVRKESPEEKKINELCNTLYLFDAFKGNTDGLKALLN